MTYIHYGLLPYPPAQLDVAQNSEQSKLEHKLVYEWCQT